MELIVAVYDDWGIGCNGTQPVTLHADRKFFRETTRGATVIAGRKTVDDFPGRKPLPGRTNIVLTRREDDIPGFVRCASPEAVLNVTRDAERAIVIGGGSVYRQMIDFCDTAYVTKVHCQPESDTFFPNLDSLPQWELAETIWTGEEDGIAFEICKYKRI